MGRTSRTISVATCVGVAALCVAVAVAADSRPADPARIMTYGEYARTNLRSPYILEYGAGEGRLLLVGVQHTLDANSDTVAKIWSEWERFRPTVAYFEGTEWTFGYAPEIVSRYGESAVVRFLAYVNRVPVASLEPDMVDEIAFLQKTWNDEQIKLFFTLRFVAERNGYGGASITEAEVANYLARGFPPTISGPPQTLEELAVSYRRYFPAGTFWQSVPLKWFDPGSKELFSNEMATAS